MDVRMATFLQPWERFKDILRLSFSCCCGMLQDLHIRQQKYRIKKNRLNLPILHSCLSSRNLCLAHSRSQDRFLGFRSLAEFTVMFFLTASVVQNKKLVWRLCLGILVGGLLLAVLGLGRLLARSLVMALSLAFRLFISLSAYCVRRYPCHRHFWDVHLDRCLSFV